MAVLFGMLNDIASTTMSDGKRSATQSTLRSKTVVVYHSAPVKLLSPVCSVAAQSFALLRWSLAGLILRVESNQNVESKIKVVEPKDPFCGAHIDALVGCSATLVL
jgi:hypothetical protein